MEEKKYIKELELRALRNIRDNDDLIISVRLNDIIDILNSWMKKANKSQKKKIAKLVGFFLDLNSFLNVYKLKLEEKEIKLLLEREKLQLYESENKELKDKIIELKNQIKL